MTWGHTTAMQSGTVLPPRPTGSAVLGAAQGTAGALGCQGTLLTRTQLAINPNPQISFCKAALVPQFVHITRITSSSQVENPALALVKFHMAGDCPAF